MRASRPNRPLNGVDCYTMENMETEMVIDIPDTPDRVSRRGSFSVEGNGRENAAAREFHSIDKEEPRKNCDTRAENGNGTRASRNTPLFRRTPMDNDKGKSICSISPASLSDSMQKNPVLNPNQHNGCTVDLSGDPQHKKEDRVSGHRRLVRNGCISPHVIAARAKQAVEHQTSSNGDIVDRSGEEKTASDDLSSVDVREIVADDDSRSRAKGKRTIGHSQTSKENGAKAVDLPSRINGETVGSGEEAGSEGWRSTRNRQTTTGCCHHSVGRDIGRHHQNNGRGENDSRRSFGSARESNKRRRRNGLPSAVSDGQEISMVGTPGEASSSRQSRMQSHRQRQGTQNPVLEVDDDDDDSSPEIGIPGCVVENDESDERGRQIEEDERLARELQEQLYQESRFLGDEEINESIARILQEEENSVRHNMHIPSVARGRSRLRERFQQSSSIPQPRASVRTTRARGYRSGTPPAALNLRFPSGMALDSRLDILEEIETAISHFGSGTLQQLDRDFNEDDYEMLLSLDENNRAGTSANLINSLPQSTVRTDTLEETCAICLEAPTFGDVIRHLPCFHRFHRDCIDPWLGRSKLCPVCKSSVA